MDQEEVARVLGLSYDASRQRLSRARTQLAETMERLEKKQSQRQPT
jgi:DNA-directed RNA polymerase specialized sigma24 family protein